MYNPNGRYKPSEYRFPYDDSSFDFVFLTSVFTHMFPQDVTNYISEISRVMKPGGRCFITYFLWNPEAEKNTALNITDQVFNYDRGTHRIVNPKQPEFAVALPETWIRSQYADVGLEIEEPIRYGHWSGRTQFTTYQDIVLATKRE